MALLLCTSSIKTVLHWSTIPFVYGVTVEMPKTRFFDMTESIPTLHAIFYVHGHQVAFIETYFWQFSVSFLHRC